MKTMHAFVAACALTVVSVMGAPAVLAAEPAKPQAKGLVLNGDAQCTSCHDETDAPPAGVVNRAPVVLAIGKTPHGTRADGRTPSCTNCHGESEKHRTHRGRGDPPPPDISFKPKAATPVAARNETCLTCHQGGTRISWQHSAHGRQDVSCTSCHQVHTQHDKVRAKASQTETCFNCHKEQRAQINRPYHHPVIEGKMTCSSCHNVHGDNPKQLIKASTNETCYTCHMEKRGPFVHNHQPVVEDCGICHQPHGTTAPGLLKTRQPFICQDCHSHDSHPGQVAVLPNGPTNSTSLLGAVARGCTNCHTNIHGSNSTVNSPTAGRFRR